MRSRIGSLSSLAMSRPAALARSLALIGAGRVAAQAVALILLPVLTANLDPTDYGVVELVVTYVSLCAPLLSLQLEMAAFRFLIDSRDENAGSKTIISTVALPIMALSVVWVLAGFAVGYVFDYRLFWYFAANLASTALFNLVTLIARGVGRNSLFATGNIAVAMITLGAVLASVHVTIFSLETYLMILAGANVVGFLVVFFAMRFYRLFSFRLFDMRRLRELLGYSLPLVPNALSWWVISAAGRTVAAVFLGVHYVGLLAVASKFAAVVTGLSTVFSMAWMEAASVSYSDSDRHAFFSKIVNQALRAFSALTISIVGAVPLMMEFLVDESFAEAYYYVPILLVGALGHSMVSFYSGVLIAQNRTGKVANTSITAAALSLAISLTFVHWIGLYAIAFSTPVAFFFMVIYRQVLLQRELRVKYDSRNLVLVAATIALVMVLYYLRIDPLPMLFIGCLISLVLIAPTAWSIVRSMAARSRGDESV